MGPPVILLGIDTPIGLALVRELGRAGIEVHGVARDRRALGLYSRWLGQGHIRPQDEAGVLPLLRRIARRTGARFVMTVSMSDALLVREAADAGRLWGLTPLLPSMAKLRLVNDKAEICRIAERLGIAVPYTWEPTLADLAAEWPGLSFPCVLKWRDPEQAVDLLSDAGLPLLKTEYVHDAGTLRRVLERYRPAGILPMVQSYVPGSGLGQMFVMRRGRATLRFQHRRLHEWPPEGGVSTLCESVGVDAHPELMARSEALLREIGWEGPAMVEYRYDERTGRAVLMEINGRFWGSLPLAVQAGAAFGLATYYALGLDRPLPTQRAYKVGLRCRFMIAETRRLLRILFARRSIPDKSLRFSRLRELASYVAGFVDGSRYYVFSWRDPLPFFADMLFVLRRVGEASLAWLPRRRRAQPAGARPVKS
ncbi:MAG TPA: carboxylate--amine ligase [Allosphingosinicella sp.]|uniref:carboxylate--amine ligase n=1 Tax=Allosphingosinicella sp. TaxID=2823234 RepID=UPI002F27901A